MPADELTRRCIACGGETFLPLVRAYAAGQPQVVHQCQVCRLGVLDSPGSADGLYDDGFYARGRQSRWLERLDRASLWLKARSVRSLVRSGRVLDIGCGNGDFLAQFPAPRYQRYGIETAAAGLALARRHHFEGLYQESVCTANLPAESFDLIVMNHVLEHIADPGPVLDAVSRLLRPTGVFVTTQPNIDSWDFRLAREQFFHLDLPRHLFHYTPASLTRLVQQHGLQVRRLTYPLAEFPQVPLYSLLSRLFPPDSILNRRRRLIFLALGPLAVLASATLATAHNASTVRAICERRVKAASPG